MFPKPTPFKTASAFNSQLLAGVYGQIAKQQWLKLKICSLLPETLSKQVLHCVIKSKKLLIYTDSSLWASQLRFHQQILLTNVGELIAEPVESIQIKMMRLQTGVASKVPMKANIPSVEMIGVIQKQVESVSDNQLKQALLRLSSTLKRLSSEDS